MLYRTQTEGSNTEDDESTQTGSSYTEEDDRTQTESMTETYSSRSSEYYTPTDDEV